MSAIGEGAAAWQSPGMRAAILTFALLTGCTEQPGQPGTNLMEPESAGEAPRQPASQAAAPVAKPFSVEEETELYDFKFGWSAEAAAIPALDKQFAREMEKAKSDLSAGAREDREERRKRGFDFHPYSLQVSYETAGQTDRLLSLERSSYSFTGGAHGSTGSGALLWDRKSAAQIAISDLLQDGQSWTGAIRQPFCVLLDREREKRRQELVRRDDMFGNCPAYAELTVFLQDTEGNARFDHVMVVADQYVAGPYAEGAYEIALPITAPMIERLKPEYRTSFEARPPVK